MASGEVKPFPSPEPIIASCEASALRLLEAPSATTAYDAAHAIRTLILVIRQQATVIEQVDKAVRK